MDTIADNAKLIRIVAYIDRRGKKRKGSDGGSFVLSTLRTSPMLDLSWSVGEPLGERLVYGDPNVSKVLILLTDGRNQVEAANGHNHSFYSAYGYAASGHIGPKDGSQTRQALDAKTATLCNNIKADKDGNPNTQDIYLHTISFAMAGEVEAQNLLRNCATPPSSCPGNQCYYDVPAPEQLSGAFANIAMGINQLRLTR